MKGKGGLDDFKLHYERLPSIPKFKKTKNKKSQSKSKKDILVNDFRLGFAIFLPHILRQLKTPDRAVILSIDDREIVPKLPQPNKKRAIKPKR